MMEDDEAGRLAYEAELLTHRTAADPNEPGRAEALARWVSGGAKTPLTDARIREMWEWTFSTNNPFCPCDLRSFTKAVRATENAHGVL